MHHSSQKYQQAQAARQQQRQSQSSSQGANAAHDQEDRHAPRADQTGKFKMPIDFYKRVLELEKEVEKKKDKCDEPLLKGLTQLYSQAIEYFGYVDQVDRCQELQMRMQSILVKPYVLECLNRFERERIEEEARTEALNPTQRVVFQSTKKQLEKLRQKQLLDKERQRVIDAENRTKVKLGALGDNDQPEESTESSDDDEDMDEHNNIAQANADIDSIVITPRTQSKLVLDFLKLSYEEGGRIELPWYTQEKLKAKQEAPVAKVHEKKNFKGIAQSEETATNIVRTQIKNQIDTLKERLQQRKLNQFRRRQTIKAGKNADLFNKTVDAGHSTGRGLDSPNMSRISPMDTTQKNSEDNESMMLQVCEQDKSLLVDDGNSILKNLDTELNNEDMPSGDEEEDEDDPEALAEIERKQEDLIEEFMGRTFDLKTEKVEEARAACKAEGLNREETKAKVAVVEKQVVALRRQGTKTLKALFVEIIENEELTLQQKVQHFNEDANMDSYREQMDKLLQM